MAKNKVVSLDLNRRPRILRKSNAIRDALAEVNITSDHLVRPIFVHQIKSKSQEITTLPGQFRYSHADLILEIETSLKSGVNKFALFPVIDSQLKDARGTYALKKNNFIAEITFDLKKRFPEIILFSDVALDPYTTSGHDGIFKDGEVLNDETVKTLCQQALILAQAGADFIAPSDMMDGRVGYIRKTLDLNGLGNTGIMSYTAKYASAFYGPFRDALGSGLKKGDKKTYQMDFRNSKEAIIEAELDYNEGADMLMVKPAMIYLDIIKSLSENFAIPITAYQVSGEYAMIKFAAKAGAIDEKKAIIESLTSIRRAGASLVFTYFANDI